MFLKRLFIVVMIALTVAYATGILFDSMYKKRWSTLFFEKTDSLLKGRSNYDIIFLGNSRVHFGINPFYVDSVTGQSSYNFGYGGADMRETMMISSVYLQLHRPPKTAVISLDLGAITKNEQLKSSYHFLYYLQNDSIHKYMQAAGFPTGLMKVFPFTRYSFFDEYNRTSLFVKGNPYPVFGHNIYKGFLNVEQGLSSGDVVYRLQEGGDTIWDTAVAYLRNTVVQLQRNGTRVIFVAAPEKSNSVYRQTPIRKTADSLFTRIAADYRLSYFHFENDAHFGDALFTDDIHLNEPGTRIYSIQLADSIKVLNK